ncbi:hypothetical protein [Pseudaquabacterium rugosum]|uniref:DUF3313 domain-containing protein n=1 Tax=Pseudaquabacterium rugosum TaxID=2984194 RepID=A0ABU9BG14_9BURK
MLLQRFLMAFATVSLAACGTLFDGRPFTKTDGQVAASLGEIESGYTYIPVDPFPVETRLSASCREAKPDSTSVLLDSLPDNAVRMLVERFDKSGAITYGASKAGVKDESYRVTVDYINADTINVPVAITKFMRRKNTSPVSVDTEPVNLFATDLSEYVAGTERYEVTRVTTTKGVPGYVFNIPVYVGVGLRVSSYVYVTGANANISGIGVIGAEAEADRLKGSLVVQTLGVNGKSVASALPIQSELNRTTAQNAIVAVGSIKALLYASETITSPRVVGLYLPFPGGRALVNALISELSKERVEWYRACPAIPKT